MNKPLLVVVSGSPASGKTTLAHLLASKINCPVLSRDEFKEGYLTTLDVEHNPLDNSADLHVYDTFFQAVDLLIVKGISIIIEAAFQDKLWKPKLLSLLDKAEIKIVLCKTNQHLLKTRFTNRISNNPNREKYHGDQSLTSCKEQFAELIENYKPVVIDTPILQVDTTNNYNPGIEQIINFTRKKNSR